MAEKNKYIYKKLVLIILLNTAIASSGFAQLYPTENINDSKYCLSLNAELEFNSNKVNNSFAYDFYSGRYLDNSKKTTALNRLNATYNLLGYQFHADLYLGIPGKKSNISYYAGFETHSLMELRFNRDFFQLFFFGNKDYTNKFLILRNLSLNYLNFQQIKGGINKTWEKKNARHTLTAGIGFNNGQSLMQYNLPYGTIYTQQDAEFINIQMQLDMKRSDTANSKFGTENGWGLCGDVAYTYRDDKNVFQCQLEDIGFIRWKKYSQCYKKDTVVYFDGIDIHNLVDISGETISGKGADSIVNAFAYSKTCAGFTEMIPLRFYVYYKRYFFNHWLSLAGSFNHYFFTLYRPQIRIIPALNIPLKNAVISIAPSFETGGYGQYNCGLGISAAISDKFFIELQTAYLNAYLNPKKSAGVGGFISIVKTL